MSRKLSIFIGVTSFSFLLFALFLGIYLYLSPSSATKTLANGLYQTNKNQAVNHKLKTEANYIVKKMPESSKITLAAIGDILVHGLVYKSAYHGGEFDFTPMFSAIQLPLEKADIAFANQESIIGGKSLGLSTYPRFNSPEEVGYALKEIGIDIVSMANNHTLDKGEQAIKNAIHLFNKLGIIYTGSALTQKESENIKIITKNNISSAFLSYTYGTNGLPVPKNKPFLVNLIDEEVILSDIRRAEMLADVTVVSLHFGNEYQRLPDQSQKELVQKLAHAGADIILGHHPHVLQPVEWIEKDDGTRSFVIYSLGNFLSAQKKIYRDIGAIIEIQITKTTGGARSKVMLHNPSATLTFVNRNKNGQYRIIPFLDAEQKGLVKNGASYEKMKLHMNQWLPELIFNE